MGMMWKTLVVAGLMGSLFGLRACKSHQDTKMTLTNPPAKMETAAEFTTRFNTWLTEANAPIQAGHDRAIANVGELNEGEEWGCEWEKDYQEINAAARKAVKETDLLGAELKRHWLAILDSATKAGTVYGVGTLVVMGRYDANCWGTDVQSFIQMDGDNESQNASTDGIKAAWTMEPMCAGYALNGTIRIDLHGNESGKLELVGTRFEGE